MASDLAGPPVLPSRGATARYGLPVTASAALRAVGDRPARRRHRRAAPPAPWLVAPLAGLWVGGGIVDSITGALGGLVGKPVEWAREAIRATVSWVSDLVGNLSDLVGEALDGLWRFVHGVEDFAHALVSWAQGIVKSVFDDLVAWVSRLVGAARDFAHDLVNGAVNWAGQAIQGVRSWAEASFRWVVDNVVRPLADRVGGLADWVTGTVVPWVGRLVDGAQAFVERSINGVWGWLRDEVAPWLPWLRGVADVLNATWGWLEWLARHPFDWWRRLWHDVANLTPAGIADAVVRDFAQGTGSVEEFLVRWVG